MKMKMKKIRMMTGGFEAEPKDGKDPKVKILFADKENEVELTIPPEMLHALKDMAEKYFDNLSRIRGVDGYRIVDE